MPAPDFDRMRQENHAAYLDERREEALAASVTSGDGRYVFARLPRCPFCGGTKHRAIRSVDNGDGHREKRTKCQTCGEKFMIILE